MQKLVAARANRRLRTLTLHLADAAGVAAREVWEGRFDDHFPRSVWQTGSGTQTNMNVNEVITNRANQELGQPPGTQQPVHANDDVNRSQSSHDSFPTVMHLGTALELRDQLLPELRWLRDVLAAKTVAFADVVKIGHTDLMDAVPMTVGQAFDTFARQVRSECRLDRGDGPAQQCVEARSPVPSPGAGHARIGMDRHHRPAQPQPDLSQLPKLILGRLALLGRRPGVDGNVLNSPTMPPLPSPSTKTG